MTDVSLADGASAASPVEVGYAPGACNIGPAEIARRRRSGHAGAIAAIVMLVILVAIDAPPLTRLLLALPATIAVAGYLQAWFRFCVAFGTRGVFNLGPIGHLEAVADDAARARDRRRARQIGAASLAIGLAVGVAAALLPIR